MKHEEQLREVKKNNTILEKKLEHERFVNSLHTLSKNRFSNIKSIFLMQNTIFHVSFALSLKFYFVIF